jgi:hypothetical protein
LKAKIRTSKTLTAAAGQALGLIKNDDMKRFLLICFLSLLTIINIYPQEYHKLIRLNTCWDHWHITSPQWWYDYIWKIYFIQNDTVLEGKTYKISRYYPYEPVNPPLLIPPFVIDTVSQPTNIFLREDTLERKVYRYFEELSPKDQLIYDFSLSVGDTLHSDAIVDCFNASVIVQYIDTVILLNGEHRKRFHFETMCGPTDYIEGIGAEADFFGGYMPVFEGKGMGGFFCIIENEIPLWNGPCEYLFVGLNSTSNNINASVYSNPNLTQLIIKVDGDLIGSNLTLFNLIGTEDLRVKINSLEMNVPIYRLQSGIYIYQIQSGYIIRRGKVVIF